MMDMTSGDEEEEAFGSPPEHMVSQNIMSEEYLTSCIVAETPKQKETIKEAPEIQRNLPEKRSNL